MKILFSLLNNYKCLNSLKKDFSSGDKYFAIKKIKAVSTKIGIPIKIIIKHKKEVCYI